MNKPSFLKRVYFCLFARVNAGAHTDAAGAGIIKKLAAPRISTRCGSKISIKNSSVNTKQSITSFIQMVIQII